LLGQAVSYTLAAALAMAVMTAIYWSERGAINEFSYPLFGGSPWRPEGVLTILGVYFLTAWVFSLLAAFILIPESAKHLVDGSVSVPITDARIRESAVVFALIGVIFAGMLRIHSLTLSVTQGRQHTTPPAVSELLLLGVTLGFGAAILIAAVGTFSPFIDAASPHSSEEQVETLSFMILTASIVVGGAVELIWVLATKNSTYVSIIEEVAEASTRAVLRESQGPAAIELYWLLSKTDETLSLQSATSAVSASSLLSSLDFNAESAVQSLMAHGLLIATAGGGFRRNPHFQSNQRSAAQEIRASMQLVRTLTKDDVERLLRSRSDSATSEPLPEPILQLVALDAQDQIDITIKLLDAVLDDLRRARLIGRDAVLLTYLVRRYWEKVAVTDIAEEFGFSREYLHRMAHWPSIELFRYYLMRRLLIGFEPLPRIVPLSRT